MPTLGDVFFLDGARGFAAAVDVTERGTPRLTLPDTSDGGRSWREQPLEASELEADLAYAGARVLFLDGQHGFVLGRFATSTAFSHGVLFRTDDGGATWTRLAQPPSAERFVWWARAPATPRPAARPRGWWPSTRRPAAARGRARC